MGEFNQSNSGASRERGTVLVPPPQSLWQNRRNRLANRRKMREQKKR